MNMCATGKTRKMLKTTKSIIRDIFVHVCVNSLSNINGKREYYDIFSFFFLKLDLYIYCSDLLSLKLCQAIEHTMSLKYYALNMGQLKNLSRIFRKHGAIWYFITS